MSKFSSPAWMMAAFFAGIFFVYSCGGGGDYANMAIGVDRGLPALTDEVNALKKQVADLEAKLAAISDDGKTLLISGRNVQIVSGSGKTDDNAALTGLGNLVIGYNEVDGQNVVRTGAHNLVVGTGHTYTSYGGLVAGHQNTVSAQHASVVGGRNNTASGIWASVSGGFTNTASGGAASISGGINNTASGKVSSVSGGSNNIASVGSTSVSGGKNNTAAAPNASVSGGSNNAANGNSASVSGGHGNFATGADDSVSGGQFCLRSGSAGNSSWGIGGATDAGPARPENCNVANDNT